MLLRSKISQSHIRTFEGTIPEAEYGGRAVQPRDSGRWRSSSTRSAEEDLKNGHLRFELDGERLKRGRTLIRMHAKNERRNRRQQGKWLLIKEHDVAVRPGDPEP